MGNFDPVSAGLAIAAPKSTAVPYFLGNTDDPEAHWRNVYSGLDGFDSRFNARDQYAFRSLDRVTKNPEEDRAQAANQAFIAERTKMPSPFIARNWESTKAAYANSELGMNIQNIPDKELYSKIADRLGVGSKLTGEAESEAGTVKPWTWKDTFRNDVYQTKKSASAFWDALSIDALPAAPSDLPDLPQLGLGNPALAGGVYNGLIRPLLSPFNVATIAVAAPLSVAAKSATWAKTVLGGMTAGFTALMGYSAAQAIPETQRILNDPNSSMQERVAALSGAVGTAAGALLGAIGTIHSVLPEVGRVELAQKMKGKTPTESAEVLRQEAVKAPPEVADALNRGATIFEEVGAYERGPEQWETVGKGPEKIAAAAVRMPDSKIVEGSSHEAIKQEFLEVNADMKVGAEAPLPEGAQEGFVTSSGRFVDKTEALKIAEDNGQVGPKEAPAEIVLGEPAPAPASNELNAADVEFDRPQSAFGQTALKNSYEELERVAHGFEEAPPTEKRGMAERWTRAGEVLAKDPEAGARLAKQLKDNPNLGLSDDQSALLLRHKVGLQNALNEASDIAFDPTSSPELRKEAQRQMKELSDDLLGFLDAVHKRGSEWGREGRWRQAIAQEDYSFATQETLLRAAKGGAELSEGERVVLQRRIEELQTKQAQLENLAAARDETTRTQAAERAVNSMARPPREPRQFRTAEKLRDQLHAKAEESKKALAGKLFTISPDVLYHMSVIGADQLYSTGLDFAKWSTGMVAELGEKVRPSLTEAWEASKKLFYVEQKADLLAKLKAKTSEERVKSLSSTAQELARAAIEQGAKGRDEVVDRVQSALAEAIPEISKRETMDAISGYGQFKPLTRDAITEQLRDVKGQLQQVAKLEDMAAGEAPKKTGVERRSPSDEERRLIKEVAERKKEGGYAITDPEKQLRTSLEATQRNVENRIKDLTQQFDTGELVPEGKPAPTSPEIEALKALRDRVAETIESVAKSPEKTPEERIAAAVESTNKAIERLEKRINDGDLFPKKKGSEPWSPELGRAKQMLAELEGFRKEMADFEQPPEVAKLARQRAKLEERIAELHEKIASGDVSPTTNAKASRPAAPEIEKLMQEREALNEQIEKMRNPPKDPQQKALEGVKSRLKKQIADLEKQITSKTKTAKTAKTPAALDGEAKALEARRDELKTEYEGIFGHSGLSDQQRLNFWKANAARRLGELQERLANKDFAKPERRPGPPMDAEASRLRGEIERVKQDFAIARSQAEYAALPKWQKGLNQVSGLARASALSGYHTLAKLATFSLGKFAETPIVEGLGAAIRMIPGVDTIAKKANLEAGAEYEGLAEYYTKAATEGASAALETLKRGKSNLKAELGDRSFNEQPVRWYDYFGIIHAAEKAPLLTGEYNLRLKKAYQWAIANRMDVTDPMVAGALRKEAFTYAERAILQENNMVADAINGFQRRLEAINPTTGKVDIMKAALSTFIRVFLTKGIVRVPVNYVWQTLERTPLGLAKGTAGAVMAHIQGVEKLTPVEANTIIRLLKVGAVGSALFIWGMIDATKDPKDRLFGGYYQAGEKRGDQDVGWGKIRIGGVEFPHLFTHNPMIESAQMGATMMRVWQSKRSKAKGGEEKGAMAGGMAALISLASESPVVNPITDYATAVERGESQKIIWEAAAGLIPQFVQNVAQDIDGKSRNPTTFGERIALTIPGMRPLVPESKAQKKKDIKERLKQRQNEKK